MWKRVVRIALLAAIPLESINLWLALHYPIDVGLPPGTSRWVELVFAQALILHFPGLWFMNWFEEHHVYSVSPIYAGLLVSGYVDTVLLLIVVILSYRGLQALTALAKANV
jgi:hypothetical protein